MAGKIQHPWVEQAEWSDDVAWAAEQWQEVDQEWRQRYEATEPAFVIRYLDCPAQLLLDFERYKTQLPTDWQTTRATSQGEELLRWRVRVDAEMYDDFREAALEIARGTADRDQKMSALLNRRIRLLLGLLRAADYAYWDSKQRRPGPEAASHLAGSVYGALRRDGTSGGLTAAMAPEALPAEVIAHVTENGLGPSAMEALTEDTKKAVAGIPTKRPAQGLLPLNEDALTLDSLNSRTARENASLYFARVREFCATRGTPSERRVIEALWRREKAGESTASKDVAAEIGTSANNVDKHISRLQKKAEAEGLRRGDYLNRSKKIA